MIRVLHDWHEVGDSILALQRLGLPMHETPQKNWDHKILADALHGVDKRSRIVDLGCGDGHTLAFLYTMGFANVDGIDFRISWRLRLRCLATKWRARTLPWRQSLQLRKGDLTQTPFPAQSCDCAISMSTIEHGVDLESFFSEAARILKRGGLLLVTTDYWEKKIATDAAARVYGLPWQIFSRNQVEGMILAAGAAGLALLEQTDIPRCATTPVLWQGVSYTFIAMLFRKEARERCGSPWASLRDWVLAL